MIDIVIADDQELVRTGFRMVLEAQPDLRVVGEAADGAEAVRAAERVAPDVVLMDIRMPNVDGLTATRRIVEATDARVLVLTTFDLDEYVHAALRGGASGFLLKDAPQAELVAAVRTIAAGNAVLAPVVTRRLLDAYAHLLPTQEPAQLPGVEELTPRERDVLLEVSSGRSNAEIAGVLHLSEATVKSHVGHVLAKLGVRDRVQAVVVAYDAGLVRPGRGGRE